MRIVFEVFSSLWKYVILALVTFLAIFVPLRLVFSLIPEEQFFPFSWVITIVFILDIVINLIKYKFSNNDEIIEVNISLKQYLKSIFILDLIAAMPFTIIFGIPALQLLRLIKLINVGRMMHFWKRREIKYSNSLSVLFFLFWAAIAAHAISCGWLAIRGIAPSINLSSQYVKAIYWCVTTLTTVGYGDVTPVTKVEMIYSIFVMLSGVGLYGYIIGNIAGIITKKDPLKSRYLENMEKLSTMTHLKKIPHDLQQRIRDYYTYIWKKRYGYDESKFVEGLPPNLKNEVVLFLKKEVIEKIPLFRDADIKFIEEIAKHLEPLLLTPDDLLFRKGDEGREMYFVVSGELAVYNNNDPEPFALLTSGDFFGEMSLFKNIPRTATIRANTYCDLYSLKIEAFNSVVARYSEVYKKIEEEIQTRETKA